MEAELDGIEGEIAHTVNLNTFLEQPIWRDSHRSSLEEGIYATLAS